MSRSRPDMLSAPEVAARLGRDPRTVHRARRGGQITGWVMIGSRWYLPRHRLADLLFEPDPLAPRPTARFRPHP